MPALRVAKLEALLVRVQTRAAESRPGRGSSVASVAAAPTQDVAAPMRRSQFDEDEVTGKAPAVAESPRVQAAPQVVTTPAKSASKIAAAAPIARTEEDAEPVTAVATMAQLEAQLAAEVPAPAVAQPVVAAAVAEPAPLTPEPVRAILEPTPLGPPFLEPEVARAKTPSPEVVAAKAESERLVPVAAAPAVPVPLTASSAVAVAAQTPAPRGRQFLVALLLILWILAVAAVVGLFFTGRLPMP